jgi:hypothetical protein
MSSSFTRLSLAALVAAAFAPAAMACSSCGCTLTTDWSSQGYSTAEGFHMDLRYDYFNQNQLRSGTGTVDRSSLSLPNDHEIQQETINRNTTLSLDYNADGPWGVRVMVPYFDRYHTTIAPGDTDISTSHTNSIGDVRILGRYHGLTDDHSVGLQFGLKLPTGSFNNTFNDGPQAGAPLDRGLQPGTGTTDLLVGLYTFGALDKDWDYFAQGLVQQPLNSRDDFKPGTGLNANFGVRYAGFEKVFPQLQFNARVEGRDSGANADIENSGATLVYFSPGVTVNVAEKTNLYGFVQVPVYQRVNGLQIEPRWTVSVGIYFSL